MFLQNTRGQKRARKSDHGEDGDYDPKVDQKVRYRTSRGKTRGPTSKDVNSQAEGETLTFLAWLWLALLKMIFG